MTTRRAAPAVEPAVPGLYELARRRALHAAHNVERAVAGTHVAEHLVLRHVTADARFEFQRQLCDAILRGPVDWAAIDALPWPEELRDERSR